jgi:SnoaL-like domain
VVDEQADRRRYGRVAGADEIQMIADDIDIHVYGEVGWAEGHGRFTMAGGGERSLRMTAVLVREDGQWEVVQSDASVGVPNAGLLG